ncbi:MAG: arylsulfatase A, partial [Limisphaerales bacterium]
HFKLAHYLMKLLSIFLVLFCLSCAQKAYNESPPNVIFIFMDDLGYGDLGCYGNTLTNTPVIDKLASEGLQLNAHYTVYPVCSPARAALLTGQYPLRANCSQVFFPKAKSGLPTNTNTMAELFKGQGYYTAMVGKWHLGSKEEFLPLNHGFDTWFGCPYSNDMKPAVLMQDYKVIDTVYDQSSWTSEYTQKATEFITSSTQPYFLYLAHSMPHVPIAASSNFLGKSKNGLFGDVIEELDFYIGELLSDLEKAGKLENTLIVLTSDNGPWLHMGVESGSAGTLSYGKFSTFEGGCRVPAIAWWPEIIAAGRTSDFPVDLMDWMPTFSQLFELETETDGASLLPLLTNTGIPKDSITSYFYGDELKAVRKGNWKLKLASDGMQWAKVPAHELALFNLKNDPEENTNLADQYPGHVNRLIALVDLINNDLPAASEENSFGSPFE